MNNNEDDVPKRRVATILPDGFGIRASDSGIFALDFLGMNKHGERVVIGSFALGKKDAKGLIKMLSDALKQSKGN